MRYEIVIGTGEKLVSGATIPSSGVITRATGKLLHCTGRIHLTADERSQLWNTARRIEQHFGFPQDIEFVIDEKGKLWIVQARQITA